MHVRPGVRVTAQALLAFVGGLAASVALFSRMAPLVSAPAPVTAGAAAALIAVAYRASRSLALHVALALGVLAGAWISSGSAPQVRDVEAHVPHVHGDADLFDALDALDADPSSALGRTIAVSGTWTPPHGGWPATVSRRIMSCCAADAVDVGFDVTPRGRVSIHSGTWVRVSGRIRISLRDGDVRYEIADATVR